MKLLNWTRRFSRRGFLAGSATTVAAVAASHGDVFAEVEGTGDAKTAELSPEQVRTLVRFARDLFPHDRLDDSYYHRAVAATLAEASKDPSTFRIVSAGVAQLDRLALAAANKPYADVAEENKRIAIIKQIENQPFFNKVYGDAVVGLYNNPDVWPKFGYEGPSSAEGGYLRRGFDDINWL